MSEQEKTTKVVQTYAQPVEVDLSRSAKGGYYWKISVKAESPIAALRQVQDIDQELRRRYVPPAASEPARPEAQASANADPHKRMEKAIARAKEADGKSPFRGE